MKKFEKRIGLTPKETKEYLSKEIWNKFLKWMVGQTCPFINGKIGYYEHDVKRFVRAFLYKEPTYFD